MDFECTRCGKCCSTLRGPMLGQIHGLTIMPEERHLFPPIIIKPMFRFRKRAKHRSGEVFMYQVDVEECPHHVDNGCQIYEDRPQICRAFPFELQGERVAIHESCPEIERLRKANATFNVPQFYQKGAIIIHNYYSNTLYRTPDIERFDLKSGCWRGMLEGMTSEHMKLLEV